MADSGKMAIYWNMWEARGAERKYEDLSVRDVRARALPGSRRQGRVDSLGKALVSFQPCASLLKSQIPGEKEAGQSHSVSWGESHQGCASNRLGSVSTKAMGVLALEVSVGEMCH